jgi:uncharacterized protein with FMN-binding domain
MRRIVYAVGGTAAGLAMLLTFKSYTGASAVSSTGRTGAAGAAATGGMAAGAGAGTGGASGTGGATGTGAASGANGAGGKGNAAGNAPSGSSPAQGATSGTQEVSGTVANTAYGPVQVRLTVTSHRIVKVTILQQPTATAHDLQIGQFAFPQLEAETLSAQSAKINAVSGATYTSGGYIQSLQSAIDRGA